MFTRHLCSVAAFVAAALSLSLAGRAPAQVPERYTADRASPVRNLGATDPAHEMDVTVWLKLRDQAYLDGLLEKLYDPKSPRYRKWLSDAELERIKPSGQQLAIVRGELAAYGLTTAVDPQGFFVRAHGTAAAVQSAFHTSLHAFEKGGRTFNVNVSPAALRGAAGTLVAESVGLDEEAAIRPYVVQRMDPTTGQPWRMPLSSATLPPPSTLITNQCFQPATILQIGTIGQVPNATYRGNSLQPPFPLQCGYTPEQIQDHYGLTAAYARGLKGDGQTIVIVDAYGSPTALEDANTFAQFTGLPPLTSANFQILYPDGEPRFINQGWALETSLDVQWAHALAPNAKIVLVVAAGAADQEMQFALQYVINNHVGEVISNSWGTPESIIGTRQIASYNRLLALAAARGISVHFASGDGGDFGVGSPVGAPSFPASSPYVTAVGGTSLNIPTQEGGVADVGWGTGYIQLAAPALPGEPNLPLDPPVGVFRGGGGGGESLRYSKPAWQSALPGKGRQVPDISAVADSETGVPVVVTLSDGSGQTQQSVLLVGGTSVACPVFTAIWALADQQAGHRLGQAAPAIAHMPAAALRDIVPIGSASNVTGVIIDSSASHSYSAAQLAQLSGPLLGNTTFFSAIKPAAFFVTSVVTFGTDSSLTTAPGWDNVTGFGSPNGLQFITAAAAN